MVGSTIVKNEITAHAVGTTIFYLEVRAILEIGVICVYRDATLIDAWGNRCEKGALLRR